METLSKNQSNKSKNLSLVYFLRILLNYKLIIFVLLLFTAIISYIYASNRVENPNNYSSSAIIKIGLYENQHGYEISTNSTKSIVDIVKKTIPKNSKDSYVSSIKSISPVLIEIITSAPNRQITINEINNVLDIVNEEHEKAVSKIKYDALIKHNKMLLARNLQLLSITDTPIKTNREDQTKLYEDALEYASNLLSLDLNQIEWQLSDIYNEPFFYNEITTTEDSTKLLNKYLIILISLVSVLFLASYSIIIFNILNSKD